MPKANQHFVPRVYLKRWISDKTTTVFYFKKEDLETGNPRNVSSILCNRHTYTIAFDDYFILDFMPEIKQDFLTQINTILSNYDADIFINDKYININEISSLSKFLSTIDNWDFKRKKDSTLPASKRGILSNIKQINSYILETALDDYAEKKWNTTLDNFIFEIKKQIFLNAHMSEISVSIQLIEEIVSILLLFMCRNPIFDCQGIFPDIQNILLKVFLMNATSKQEKQEIYSLVSSQMRGAWLVQIYKALFNDDTSFFHHFLQKIKTCCQITILYAPENNGSFITSDNPAFSYISTVTNANYNAIYFPLTPQYLLLIGKGKPNSFHKVSIKKLSHHGVKSFNRIILSNAAHDIVSNRKHLGFIL